MPSDKELLYQILDREIDNFLVSFGPLGNLLSAPAKQYIFNFLDPYVDAFLFPNTKQMNSEAASSFAKEEMNNKIDAFMKKFEAEKAKKDNEPKDYIV